jgi:hypothetical protein
MPDSLPAARPPRHEWGAASAVLYRTERVCKTCGLVKVTHHDDPRGFSFAWSDWFRVDVGQVKKMPACVVAPAEVAP